MKNAVGTRVKSVMIRCSHCKVPSYEQLDLDEQYTVIMPKYLVNGGDQFQMIKDGIINVVELSEYYFLDDFDLIGKENIFRSR